MKNITVSVIVRIPIKLRDLILEDIKYAEGYTISDWICNRIEIGFGKGEYEADADIEDQIKELNNCIKAMKAPDWAISWSDDELIKNYEDQIKILEKQNKLLAEIDDLNPDNDNYKDDCIDKRAELEKLENRLNDLKDVYSVEDDGEREDEYRDDIDLYENDEEYDEDYDDGTFGTGTT